MRALITTGPSYAPIDLVRRITNVASGEIGTLLAESYLAAGHEVFLARGEGSTYAAPGSVSKRLTLELFGTNEDLDELLHVWAQRHSFDIVLHAAALSDFQVKEIHVSQTFPDGERAHDVGNREKLLVQRAGAILPAKISSDAAQLHLVLTQSKKLLPSFRKRFGEQARLVGWKYELDGTREAAIAKARNQIACCATSAAVVNGQAYGPGFGICGVDGTFLHCAEKSEVVRYLTEASL